MTKFLHSLLISTLAVFIPIQAALITVGVLTFSDLILGLMAANKRGEKITSAGLRRTMSKLFIYEVGVLLAFLCETYLMGGFMPIAKIVSGLIGTIELKSCFENLDEIYGSNLFAMIISKLGSQNGGDNNQPPSPPAQ